MKILLVEDDMVSRMITGRVLGKFGHDCVTAKNGQEAWEMLESSGAEVVISDWMMPGMDGLELCRRVRQNPLAPYIYFILLTALGNRENVLAGMQAGVDDYLTKPLDQDELKARLIAAERVMLLHRRLAAQTEELERRNRELFEQAHHDPMTELGNRLKLREETKGLRARVEQNGRPQYIALCSLDQFDKFSTHYGQFAADEALCKVAKALREVQRAGGSAYRYSEEKFCLLLAEPALAAATAALEHLRAAVAALAIGHAWNGATGVVTISAGISALTPGDGATIYDALQRADGALYAARESGGDAVRVDLELTPEAVL